MVKLRLLMALCVILGFSIGSQRAGFAFSRKAPMPEAGAAVLLDNQVWITRADGAQSCTPNSGQSLDDGAADLRNAKVRVLDSRKGSDGKMRMQMCGAPTGKTNAYLIPKEDLPQAVARGYVQAH